MRLRRTVSSTRAFVPGLAAWPSDPVLQSLARSPERLCSRCSFILVRCAFAFLKYLMLNPPFGSDLRHSPQNGEGSVTSPTGWLLVHVVQVVRRAGYPAWLLCLPFICRMFPRSVSWSFRSFCFIPFKELDRSAVIYPHLVIPKIA